MDVSVSKKRNIPAVSGGYSSTNTQEYRNNRINIVGSCKPFLLESIESIPVEVKQRLARLICNTIKLLGIDVSEISRDSVHFKEREAMRLQFWISLGMKGSDTLYQYFQVEGFSLISEFLINFHLDTKNDGSPTSDSTFSLKSSVRLCTILMNIPNVKVMMKRFGLKEGDCLPISLMLYKRKVVDDYCRKHAKVASYGTLTPDTPHDSNRVTRAVLEALHDVEADTNYSKLWDFDDAWRELLSSIGKAGVKAKNMNNDVRQCMARCFTTLPSFDKMVRYHWVIYVMNKLLCLLKQLTILQFRHFGLLYATPSSILHRT